MLVHICCSVDSHYFLSELHKAYPDENLVGFFYNPNIHPKEEHDLRLQDVRRSCNMLNIKLIEGEYDTQVWFENVKGLEDEPEKGDRCNVCFDTRLVKTAQLAKEMQIQKFTTTLLSSPMKEQQVLYKQGDIIAAKNDLEFIKINVRANGGVNKQNELAKEDKLYRQNYCGCQFALKQQRSKQDKVVFEMMSNVSGQIMPASNEYRKLTFNQRDILEKEGKGYVLTQQENLVWRLLLGRVWHKKEVIPSYIIARSNSKKRAKSSKITWAKPKIESFYQIFQTQLKDLSNKEKVSFLTQKEERYKLDSKLLIGFSQKDDSMFIDINTLNFFFNTDYKNVADMIKNPPKYTQEMHLRYGLCGMESMNPIVILDTQIPHDITLEIQSVFQNERNFVVFEEM